MMNEQALDFDDIFDIWQPAWWESPWFWGALVGGFFVVGSLLYVLVRTYRLRSAITDPREIALKRLYAVNPAVGLTEQREFKFFYAELLGTIKEYLTRCYGYKSLGQTDHELLVHLKKHANAALFCSLVEQLVEHGLTIKFASLSGKNEQAHADYSAVLEVFSREKGRQSI